MRDVTNTFNEGLERPVSMKTLQRVLHQEGYHIGVTKKMVVQRSTGKNVWTGAKNGKKWQVAGQWVKVIFTDERRVETVNDNRVYIWRKADEANRPEYVSSPKTPEVSVTI